MTGSAREPRVATLDDVPALLALMAPFNEHEHIPYDPAKVEPALVRLLSDPSIGLVRVLGPSDDVEGYVILAYGFDLEFAGRDAFVTELFVRDSSRGQGLADVLLEAAERDARAAGVKALHLMVRPENTRAYRIYGARGFERVPRDLLTKKLG